MSIDQGSRPRARGVGRWISRNGTAAMLLFAVGCSGDVVNAPNGIDGPGPMGMQPRPGGGQPPGGGNGMTGAPVASANLGFAPRALQWQRLTTEQLRNTISDVFGADAPHAEIEPDASMDGFANIGGAKVAISSQGVEKLGDLSYALAKFALAEPRRSRFARCTPAPTTTTVRACAEEMYKRLGRVLYRRPVDVDTLGRLVALAESSAQTLGDPWSGLETGLAAMLQSPRFLYAVELPGSNVAAGQVARVDGYTAAARLSFLLTNSSPDEALLDAAGAGELSNPTGVRQQVERLMKSPRFKTAMRTFFASMFDLEKVRGRMFDRAVYPKATDTLGTSGFEETMRFLEHQLIEGNGDYREALFARTGFVNKELAAVYGLPAPTGTGLTQVMLPPNANRFGLLTQVGFLAAASPPNDANTIVRGLSVRENLLCQHVPEPPADLNPQLPPVPPGKMMSKRERLTAHREDPACNACHQAMDPIGLALEVYDGIGAYRTSDMGLPIDPTGELDGVKFTDVAGFIRAIQNHPDFTSCLVKKVYRFALGHKEGTGEAPFVTALSRTFEQGGRKLVPLIVALTTHDGFLHATMPPR